MKVEGTVLGPDGQGFGGATVVLVDSATGHAASDRYVSPDGEFVFGVRPGGVFLLIATGGGDTLAPDTVVVDATRGASNHTLSLSYPPPDVAVVTPVGGSAVTGIVDVVAHVGGGVEAVEYWAGNEQVCTDGNVEAGSSHCEWRTWRHVDGPCVLTAKALGTHGEVATDSVRVVIDNAPSWVGMSFLPAGRFLQGKEGVDAPDNARARSVYLSSYYADQFEVTNGLYRQYIEEEGAPPPRYWMDPTLNEPALPVVGVGWEQARGFCAWAGKRLPTEAEWERAAKGTEALDYPWGNAEPTPELANYGENVGRPVVGDRYPPSRGLHNMAGNVSEWVADLYDPDYYLTGSDTEPGGPTNVTGDAVHVIRGGSWKSEWRWLQTFRRRPATVDEARQGNDQIGFRCAREE